MRTTKCDICGMKTTVRNPQSEGFKEVLAPYDQSYFDFCPACAKKYDDVKRSAEQTKQATLLAWLNAMTEDDDDIPQTVREMFGGEK